MLRYANNADQEQMENDFDPEKDEAYYRNKEKEVKWYDQVLLNRPLKVVLAFLALAVILPALVYHFVLTATLDLPASDGYSTGSCLLPRTRRIPCGLPEVVREICHPQCCYDEENGLCFHRLPSRFSYIMDRPWSEGLTLHPRVATEPFARRPSVPGLRMSVDEVSASHVSFAIYDPTKIGPQTGRRLADKLYEYEVSTHELDISVRAGRRTLLETDRGPLVAADDIWEISIRITNESMYGLEEIPLLPGTTKVVYSNRDSSSSIPLIFARNNGSFHGLLFVSKSPVEVQVLPENHLLFRTITDESLQFHVFAGPTPQDVMRDAMLITGGQPDFPYWILGPHFCSETASPMSDQYQELVHFLGNATEEGLAMDSHCGVAPLILDSSDDEASQQLLRLGAEAVAATGARFVPHLSPYIRYERPEDETTNSTESQSQQLTLDPAISDIIAFLIQDPEFQIPYLGLVNESLVLYPDYSILNSLVILRNLWPFDDITAGIILENNWPLDESEKLVNETYRHLPYFSQAFENAFTDTIPWNSVHVNSDLRRPQHIHHHNSYGELFLRAVANFTGDTDTVLWSTSQWMNTKVPFNRQNVDASWANLRRELVIAALGGVSGSWLMSSPICGDTENFDSVLQAELCVKWYLAATYIPLVKVHSNNVQRDPLAFQGSSKYSAMRALNTRLSLLPYFNTVLQSGPLLRPMFYQYPEEETLHDLSSQFNVGEALLVAPNLLPQQTLVNVRLPLGTWYELGSGLALRAGDNGVVTVPTATADFVTLIRGGHIVVLQEDVQPTSEATRLRSPFSFVVALECTSELDESAQNESTDEETICYAQGELVLSKNMTLIFIADSETLTIEAVGDDWVSFCDASAAVWASTTRGIKVFGLDDNLNNFDTYYHRDIDTDLCDTQINGKTVLTFV